MDPTDAPRRRATLPASARTTRTTVTTVLLLVLAAGLLAGCSSGGGGDAASTDTAEGSAAGPVAPEAPGSADGGGSATEDGATLDRATGEALGTAPPDARPAVARRAVISTGTVSLESRDVEQARFDVQRVVDQARGEVADEQTGTDRRGVVRRSRLVLRVPAAAFDDVMTALARLDAARLRSAERVSEDVTTQVIDTAARVRAQEASLERVELLLGRAERLRDVVAVEAQLTRRQAELDSLKQQQAYLADQTALATVTVLIERPQAPRPPEREEEAGFVAGLRAGWDALVGSTVTVLTVVGAVLPFLAVLAAVAVPGWLLLRRLGAGRRHDGGAGGAGAGGAGVSGGTAGRTRSAAPAGPGPSTG